MPNFKITGEVKKNFTKIPNSIIKDKELTSDAFRVISFLLSLGEGFHITTNSIIGNTHLTERRVRMAIKLLQDVGYITIFRTKSSGKFDGCFWEIRAEKIASTDVASTDTVTADTVTADTVTARNVRTDFAGTDFASTDTVPTVSAPDSNRQIDIRQNRKDLDEEIEDSVGRLLLQESKNGVVVDPPKSSNSLSSSSSFSSSPSKNGPGQPQVISEKEYLFMKFLDKYPKAPLPRELDDTRKAFFEIPDLEKCFGEIDAGLDGYLNSAECRRDNGRWIKKPLNFIREKAWEKYKQEFMPATKVDMTKILQAYQQQR